MSAQGRTRTVRTAVQTARRAERERRRFFTALRLRGSGGLRAVSGAVRSALMFTQARPVTRQRAPLRCATPLPGASKDRVLMTEPL